MRVVDLFCGAGGLSLGLEKAGFEMAAGFDCWRPALDAYGANLGHPAIEADLSDIVAAIRAVLPLAPSVVAGGPPCQDFSAAGSRTEGARADLTVAFATIAVAVRPTWILLENVPMAAKSAALGLAREIIRRAGYGITEQVLDASLYGVPQRRRRLVLLARLGDGDCSLASTLAGAADTQRSTPKACGLDLPEAFYVHPRVHGKRAVWSPEAPAPTVRSTNRPPTSLSKASIPDGIRELTHAERAALQTFPADWVWPEASKSDLETLIANAVPVEMARRLGSVMRARDEGSTAPLVEDGFRRWLRRRGMEPDEVTNVAARLKRARGMIGGSLADTEQEIRTLEQAEGFGGLSPSLRSHLRRAVRLHSEWRAEERSRRPGRSFALVSR